MLQVAKVDEPAKVFENIKKYIEDILKPKS